MSTQSGRAVMVLGCTSDAGKSFLVAGLCRWLSDEGLRVAPFKAQNMSNNAAVCPDGAEIGRAQHLQALAARVEPEARHNPVLLKPIGETASRVVVDGRPAPDVERLPWTERTAVLWPVVERSLRSLLAEHDVVVIEGAGSPAEVNLRASDIVNCRVALAAGAATYLVADIDRGGAFAHLLGTWQCLEPGERALIRGFVLNRFRGDAALLGDGPAWLERQTGVPVAAVVPWLAHVLPEEDRLLVRGATTGATGCRSHTASAGAAAVRVAVLGYPFASNVDELDPLATRPEVDVEVLHGPTSLEGYDVVVLPGSRNVGAGLSWLREQGLAEEIRRSAARGAVVVGICGGMQMLGRRIVDPLGLEAGDAEGLGLLDLSTEMAAGKTTRLTRTTLLPTGEKVEGYEIHHGVTRAGPGASPVLAGGLGWAQGDVVGVYVHGLFGAAPFVRHVLGRFGVEGGRDWDTELDAELDRVAAHLAGTGLTDDVRAALSG